MCNVCAILYFALICVRRLYSAWLTSLDVFDVVGIVTFDCVVDGNCVYILNVLVTEV